MWISIGVVVHTTVVVRRTGGQNPKLRLVAGEWRHSMGNEKRARGLLNAEEKIGEEGFDGVRFDCTDIVRRRMHTPLSDDLNILYRRSGRVSFVKQPHGAQTRS